MAKRTALLAMDFQEGIVDRYPDDAPVRAAADAVAAARAAGIPIVFVRVAFRPGHPEIDAGNAIFGPVKGSGRMHEEDARIVLDVEPDDVVVTKRRVGAFSGSDLEVVLRGLDVRSLVLCGIATSGVVLSTLRLAADLDFELTVLSDACADGDDEVHRVLLEKVFPRQATVTDVAGWTASLSHPPRDRER